MHTRTNKAFLYLLRAQVKASPLGGSAFFAFIAPPSLEALEERMRVRGSESEEDIQQRLANAAGEMERSGDTSLFNVVIVNNELQAAYVELQQFIEQCRPGTFQEGISMGTVAVVAHAAQEFKKALPQQPAPEPEPEPEPEQQPAAPIDMGTAAVVVHAANEFKKGAEQARQEQPAQPMSMGTAATVVHAVNQFKHQVAAPPPRPTGARSLPIRQYMDRAVMPVLREGLKAMNEQRPEDPLQFLADFLVSHKSHAPRF